MKNAPETVVGSLDTIIKFAVDILMAFAVPSTKFVGKFVFFLNGNAKEGREPLARYRTKLFLALLYRHVVAGQYNSVAVFDSANHRYVINFDKVNGRAWIEPSTAPHPDELAGTRKVKANITSQMLSDLMKRIPSEKKADDIEEPVVIAGSPDDELAI